MNKDHTKIKFKKTEKRREAFAAWLTRNNDLAMIKAERLIIRR